LTRALEIQASSAEAHAGLAVAYAKLGQDEKAHDAADRAVELGANRDVMDKAIEDIRQRR